MAKFLFTFRGLTWPGFCIHVLPDVYHGQVSVYFQRSNMARVLCTSRGLSWSGICVLLYAYHGQVSIIF